MFLLQSLESCNVRYGRYQGRLDAQCNVRLKDIGKTTVREFCKNEVITNKTASTLICAPVNNLLSQSKQKQEQSIGFGFGLFGAVAIANQYTVIN